MRILWVTFFVVLVDQVSKLLVKGVSIPFLGIHISGMRYGSSIPVLGDFFRLTYIENPGMAFGFNPGGKLFFSLFSIALSAGILYYLYRARDGKFTLRFSLALILGGAIGNMIDRTFYSALFEGGALFYGKVVDFFDVDFFDIHLWGFSLTRWPIFNVADAAVSVGIVLMLLTQHHRATSAEHASPPIPSQQKSEQGPAPRDEREEPASL